MYKSISYIEVNILINNLRVYDNFKSKNELKERQ